MAGTLIVDKIQVDSGNTFQVLGNTGSVLLSANAAGITFGSGSAAAPSISTVGDTNTGIFFPAADTIAFAEGGVEAMRIDSSGNMGLGTSSPNSNSLTLASKNVVCNDGFGILWATSPQTQIAGYSSGVLQFFAGSSTERARIDSSGNFLVGNSAQIWDERLSARNSASNVLAGFYAQSTSYTSSVIRAQAETAAGTGWYLFEGRSSGGTFQYGIRGNGTVATSDERRKKNIEPARSYLQDICSIPVVKYNWKSDEDDAPKELGWLAQDVAKVFPNMVVTHHDGPNDDQEVLLLKKEVFLPILMKCIQEQQAMIKTLQDKVAALEAAQ